MVSVMVRLGLDFGDLDDDVVGLMELPYATD
jgi:hypothetical protein